MSRDNPQTATTPQRMAGTFSVAVEMESPFQLIVHVSCAPLSKTPGHVLLKKKDAERWREV